MSDERIIAATHGFTTPVVRPVARAGSEAFGIGFAGIVDHQGTARLAVTIVHPDGGMLSALLDGEGADRAAESIALFQASLDTPDRKARH